MNNSTPSLFAALNPLLRRCATSFKLVTVAVLILLLLIPLQMVRSILAERLGRREEAVANITGSWGREQKIVGPVLVVPYRYPVKAWKEQPAPGGRMERVEATEMGYAKAYFLPASLAVEGQLTPTKLWRGIYEAVVYSGSFQLTGVFEQPDFEGLSIPSENVLWDEATVTFAIPDLRGVKEALTLSWGGKRHTLSPGSKVKDVPAGAFSKVGRWPEGSQSLPFKLELTLNGSGGISFAPVGAVTTVRLSSPWPDPSFFGAVLPSERRVGGDGFEATWRVSNYARDYAQQWKEQEAGSGVSSGSIQASLFGVNFLAGIDAYRNTERAIKYAALFMVLVFVAFFVFEVLAALRIHPLQYAMVGAALCLFYLALLSLSEFIPFGVAYLTAAAATTLLVCVHSFTMLKSGVRTGIIGALMAGIYGYLYVALQLQDYALLLGTAALFMALGALVVLTRHIDWYAWDGRAVTE